MKTSFVRMLILFIISILGTPLFANDGNSGGGGELIRDANNPWFVINTKKVSYCVEFDKRNFSKLSWTPEKLIEKAVLYWKTEFEDISRGKKNEKTGVATQQFIEEACHASTDIRFQFGVLHQNQRRYFKDPTQFVSAAIRTSYDVVNLKGKGFVYISPDSGPLRFQTEKSNIRTWEVGGSGAVYAVLKHELGHVFGIPHIGRYVQNLMHVRYPEYVVTHVPGWFSYALDNGHADQPFFSYKLPVNLKSVYLGGMKGSYFGRIDEAAVLGLPSTQYGPKIRLEKNEIKVYAEDDFDGKNVIGIFTLDWQHQQVDDLESLPIYLTSRQNVFTKETLAMAQASISYFSSATLVEVRIPIIYRIEKTGVTWLGYIEYGPYGMRIGGVINGEYIDNILFD